MFYYSTELIIRIPKTLQGFAMGTILNEELICWFISTYQNLHIFNFSSIRPCAQTSSEIAENQQNLKSNICRSTLVGTKTRQLQ
jgi:hypothetical protein